MLARVKALGVFAHGVVFAVAVCISNQALVGQTIEMSVPKNLESAHLGIEVTDSPGVGVLVNMVAIGGPADLVGIRSGDYLLSINGDPIETPSDLVKRVAVQKPGDRITLGVWRAGEEMTKQALLATSVVPVDAPNRAWLGVMLESDGYRGAKITMVIPGSPAARANLAVGDLIVAINDQPVESAADLVNAIENLEANETVAITFGGKKESKREVKLGAIVDAPPIFSYRMPMPDLDTNGIDSFIPIQPLPIPRFPTPPQLERSRLRNSETLEEQMTEIRKQFKELREQVQGMLEKRNQNAPLGDQDEDDPETIESLPDDDASQYLSSPPYVYVVHSGDRNRYSHRPNYRYE
ncbi:putative periplasmic serine endoprotease DegP-like precursor [Planctomycetes bacterium CA13]|uniref:Putative periplasmic serine endoprotease DegP-like n=1 Tax=Novipirellula herctigrandis TaxID=2527986 RepID=A0A5C5YX55_9BACT|nr:putative periplasmic serine endoprotease DegP-like precursor [Planctomycetes bacterium CA13]